MRKFLILVGILMAGCGGENADQANDLISCDSLWGSTVYFRTDNIDYEVGTPIPECHAPPNNKIKVAQVGDWCGWNIDDEFSSNATDVCRYDVTCFLVHDRPTITMVVKVTGSECAFEMQARIQNGECVSRGVCTINSSAQ